MVKFGENADSGHQANPHQNNRILKVGEETSSEKKGYYWREWKIPGSSVFPKLCVWKLQGRV
ncbi:hypothetical protein C0J52_11924 [Blattella germanica]|nr:hypothetical protein C0J52_11924 [Blattella germanica]